MRSMKSSHTLRAAAAAFAVAVATGTAAPAAAQESSSLERLGWMAGCWEGTLSSGAIYEEAWMSPRAGTMLGTSRMIRGDRTVSWEFMRIVEGEAGVVYIAQPGNGQPPTPFPALEIADGAVTFENLQHDFPQRILYRRTAETGLLARIEGERGGELRGLDFPLARVACPG